MTQVLKNGTLFVRGTTIATIDSVFVYDDDDMMMMMMCNIREGPRRRALV
jgi:hypothetical protein